jgi:hypothetical protein
MKPSLQQVLKHDDQYRRSVQRVGGESLQPLSRLQASHRMLKSHSNCPKISIAKSS